MLTYKNIDSVNFIAIEAANGTNDNNEIISRLYDNGVEINYTIDKKNKIVHMLYIESAQKNKGCGTNALNEFIKEFYDYSIEIEALFYLSEWYEKFGFQFVYAIDEMLCYKMILKKGV